jgi:hypothetical protein
MGKRSKADKSKRTWAIKTKTPKGKRSGIFARSHHKHPEVRVQAPIREQAFLGVTNMRVAFEELPADALRSKLGRKIFRLLRGYRGTFKTRGWRKLR